MISNLIKIFFKECDTPTTLESHTPTYPNKFQSKYVNFMGNGICNSRWNLIPLYALNRTYHRIFMRDLIRVIALAIIPLYALIQWSAQPIHWIQALYEEKRVDYCGLNCKTNVNYSVKNSRVLPQPYVVFIYIVVTCGGHRMSNHLSHLGLCNSPHDIERNYYGYTS